MAKKINKNTEDIKDLKQQTQDSSQVKKGYNEKNEVQPHGSFKPDGKGSNEVAPKKSKS